MFGKKKTERKLSDFDEQLLNDMRDKTAQQTKDLTFGLEEENYKCRLCEGQLVEVKPKITMEDLILYECENCEERIYLKG